MKIHGKIMERPISTREHGETGKTAETWPYKPQQVGYKSCGVLKHLTYVTIVYSIEYVHHDTSLYRQRYNWVPCCCTIYKLKLPRYLLETFMISGLRSWTRAAFQISAHGYSKFDLFLKQGDWANFPHLVTSSCSYWLLRGVNPSIDQATGKGHLQYVPKCLPKCQTNQPCNPCTGQVWLMEIGAKHQAGTSHKSHLAFAPSMVTLQQTMAIQIVKSYMKFMLVRPGASHLYWRHTEG